MSLYDDDIVSLWQCHHITMPSWVSLNPSECQDISAINKVGCFKPHFVDCTEKRASLSFFSSIVRHASTQRRTPALRGMSSQHLRTFERSFGEWGTQWPLGTRSPGALGPCGTQLPGTRSQGQSVVWYSDATPLGCHHHISILVLHGYLPRNYYYW